MFEDLYSTFKKMSPLEKGAMLLIVVGVVVFALYMRARMSSQSQQQVSTTTGLQSAIPGNPGDFFGNSPIIGAPISSTGTGTGASGTPIINGPISSAPNPFFGPGVQVIQRTANGVNSWFIATNNKSQTPLAGFFPSGTQFFGGPNGQAFYELPGTSQELPLSSVGMYGHFTSK